MQRHLSQALNPPTKQVVSSWFANATFSLLPPATEKVFKEFTCFSYNFFHVNLHNIQAIKHLKGNIIFTSTIVPNLLRIPKVMECLKPQLMKVFSVKPLIEFWVCDYIQKYLFQTYRPYYFGNEKRYLKNNYYKTTVFIYLGVGDQTPCVTKTKSTPHYEPQNLHCMPKTWDTSNQEPYKNMIFEKIKSGFTLAYHD